MRINEKTHAGADKVKAYGWESVDKPGRMMMINKSQLVVNHDYQRDVSASDMKVKRIASEWSWVSFGAIVVGLRNGVLSVIDGQHRVQAALKRSDIVDLPCIVFETDTMEDEAIGFLRTNRNRKPMSFTDAFKALLVSGDPVAIKARDLIEGYDRRIARASEANTFTAVRSLMDCISADEQAARRSMMFVMALCEGDGVHQQLIHAAFLIERRSLGETLSDKYWIEKARRMGREDALRAINRAVAFRGASGAAVWAEGLLQAINKGQRSRVFAVTD